MSLFTPTIEFSDYKDRARYLLAWRLCVTLTPVLLALTILFAAKKSLNTWSFGFGLLMLIVCISYMRITKGYKGFYVVTGVLASIVIHYSANAFIDEPHFSDPFWIMLIVLAAYFGVGMRWGSTLLGMNMLGMAYFVFFTLDDHLEAFNTISTIDGIGLVLEFLAGGFSIGYIIYQFVKIQRITEVELRKVNEELEENYQLLSHRDHEKTVLLKEIHHRVKNNLQIIISLLRLQQAEMENGEARSKFHEMTNRVMVMSSIHQKLYQQDDLTDIDLGRYIEDLSSELITLFQAKSQVGIDVKCEYGQIDLKTIVPVGLLINELLSNSLKYAFEELEEGKIVLEIKDRKQGFELCYSDNGNWKTNGQEPSGFGLELIDILTEQLNGTKELNRDEQGTHYVFHLQKLTE